MTDVLPAATDTLAAIPDLTDPRSFDPAPPYAAFAELRRRGGLHRQERADAPGFWSATRYRDLDAVFRDATGFSCESGMTLDSALGSRDPAAAR